MHANRVALIAAATLAASWVASTARAQPAEPAPTRSPPSWDALAHCADISADEEVAACFRAAMKAAGYQPTPKVAADRRRRFGLDLPVIRREHAPKPPKAQVAQTEASHAPAGATPDNGDDRNRVSVELSDVATIPPENRLLLVTTDGAVWRQPDDERVSPCPKPGQKIQIERNSFGGYFCRFDRLTKVRCTRRN